MATIHGYTLGLKPSRVLALQRLYRRRVDPTLLVTAPLANELAALSQEVGRQVGLLLDRGGNVAYVVVGDAYKLEMPEVGRLRAGAGGRLRGLRLVHTHLSGEDLTRDDLADLLRLRFDLVAAILVQRDGRAGQVRLAHLSPERSGEADPWQILPWMALDQVEDIRELVEELETGFAESARTRLADEEEGAILVHVSSLPAAQVSSRLDELEELTRSAGVTVLERMTQRRAKPNGRTVVGGGKLEEINHLALQIGATLIVFDHDLAPSQARNIAGATDLKVIDRSQLILDIFAQRARSRDGKLQVELAQLRYALPRLSERDDALSRLTGGIGGRGPGETKLEVSKRRAKERITKLEGQVNNLRSQRLLRRQRRRGRGVPVIAIVGYTNAGKSTLLNTLTGSEVDAEDKLFATLDPTSRRIHVPGGREMILTDTVGFLRDLPDDLVAAFKATLEELHDADALVHVVDILDPERDAKREAVERILGEMGLATPPRLLLLNKCDGMAADEATELARRAGGYAVSARSKESLAPVLNRLNALFPPKPRPWEQVEPAAGEAPS